MPQMSSTRAGEVESALLAVVDGSQLRQPAASLQLPVRLLHAARPGNFPSFRAFRRWQGATCAALSAILVWSAVQHRLEQACALARCEQLSVLSMIGRLRQTAQHSSLYVACHCAAVDAWHATVEGSHQSVYCWVFNVRGLG